MRSGRCASPFSLKSALCLGSCVSVVLQLTQVYLANRQRSYSQTIQGEGQLLQMVELLHLHRMAKYYGAKFVGRLIQSMFGRSDSLWVSGNAHKIPDARSTDEWMLSEIDLFTSQMIGERLDEKPMAYVRGPGEIPDEHLRAKVRNLRQQYAGLLSHNPAGNGANLSRAATITKGENALRDISKLGKELSEAAQDWIHIMMIVHVLQVALQFAFYAWFSFVFWNVWTPFINNFHDLQTLHRQQRSLLRADFDAVIEISMCHPFTVQQTELAFDDLVGKPMLGVSILDAALDDAAKDCLQAFVSRGISQWAPADVPIGGLLLSTSKLRNLLRRATSFGNEKRAQSNMESCAALKMNSRWRCDVEIYFVGRAVDQTAKTTALLAVRQLGALIRECPVADASLQSSVVSTDFHSWTKKIDAKNIDNYRQDTVNIGSTLPSALGNRMESASSGGRSLKEAVLSSRASTQSSSKSSGSLASVELTAKYTSSRPLKDLKSVNMILAEGRFLDEFALSFSDDSLHKYGKDIRPHIKTLLIDGAKFLSWLDRRANALPDGDDVDVSVRYDDAVCFRPPNSCCASSKVILRASSASLERMPFGEMLDDVCTLYLHDVCQMEKPRTVKEFMPAATIPEGLEFAISL